MDYSKARIREENAKWIDAHAPNANPMLKQASDDKTNAYLQTKIMEDAIFDKILPVEHVTNADMDRTLTSTKPFMMIEVEPESTGAVTVQFGTNPNTVILEGQRIPIFFNRIMTDKYTKDIDELRMWDMDIRQIICDQQVKWMAFEIDRRFLFAANNALSMHAAFPDTELPCLWRTYSGGVTRENYIDSLSIMLRSRAHFHPVSLLMNEITANEFFKWGFDEMGGSFSQEMLTGGEISRTMMGKKFNITQKHELIPHGRIYMFAEPKFLGRNYILSPNTMFVENQATKISWFMYETRGGAICSATAIACADFNIAALSSGGEDIQFENLDKYGNIIPGGQTEEEVNAGSGN